jgi:alcohol dehydrogenase
MSIQTFGFLTPQIVFGVKSAENIGEHVKRMGAKHVLVISDRGLEKAGLVDQLSAWIGKANIPVTTYTNIDPDPSVENVRNCVKFAREANCDLVVGMGGGSAMDCAKAVAALLGNEGDILDFLGQNRIPHKGVPTILMPTTAGTGSEIGRGALFYVPERKSKEALFSPYLLTDLALIDPVLGLTAPASVTAASGIDALCHAIESYIGRAANSISMPFAELGIKWCHKYLAAVVADGSSLSDREGMSLGCLYASIALANANTHLVHAMAYPLQGKNRIAHGRANGVLLPYVLNALSPALPEKFTDIATWMGLDPSRVARKDAGVLVAEAVTHLLEEIKIPTKMSLLGVTESQLDEFTQDTVNNHRLLDNCPVSLDAAQIKTIFKNAL